VSCFGPAVTGRVVILLSGLVTSFGENIRVRRFVMEGFSGPRGSFCGSEGGVGCPLRSVLGTARPFCAVGRETGDATVDEVCDGVGEGCAVSEGSQFVGGLVVAIGKRCDASAWLDGLQCRV
jgi:hypothetical protein